MGGGIIHAQKAAGDVYFINNQGKEVIDPSKDVEVKMDEDFPGVIISDAIEEAKRFAIGAIKKKIAQKMRGFDCNAVVRNIKLEYKIKFGFKGQELDPERELIFKAGDQIVKKGEHGTEFFWIKEGIVEIEGVEYHAGSVFGRAAFSDQIRKKDAYAKTDAVVIAINKDHPDLVDKIPILLEKFAQEVQRIKRVRPKAKIDKINLED
ncbi:MAG: cyclic nucleotide-binding domain-containing protein [Spirochaetales bacterium]|nr:cyclic nucleotide-binding domain-containing protein [Spirochaetales bacterium]